MTKQPNQQLAQQLLADWWLNNTEITSLDFKNELRDEYPDHIWNQQWVSHFLENSGHRFVDNGMFRVYLRNNTFVQTSQPAQVGSITSTISIPVSQPTLELVGNLLHGQVVTKRDIKKAIGQHSVVNDLSNFDEELEDSNFQFTGEYTADNHKKYVWLADDEYWSRSNQIVLKLNSLAKPHIKNSLMKRYPHVTLDYVIQNPNEEASKLVKQYYK